MGRSVSGGLVGGEKQTKQVSGTAKRAGRRGDPPNRGQGDPSLTPEGGLRMVMRKDKVVRLSLTTPSESRGVEIGNSGLILPLALNR